MPSPGRSKSLRSLRRDPDATAKRSNIKGPTPYATESVIYRSTQNRSTSNSVPEYTPHGTWPSHGEPSTIATLHQPHWQHQTHASNVPPKRTSTDAPLRISTMSSKPLNLSRRPSKEKGLKATIRRLFGSKQPRLLINPMPHDFSYSDPGHLIIPQTPRTDQHGQRAPSHIAGSVGRTQTRSSALKSKTVATSADDRAISPPQHSPPQRRRNTLPSLILSEREAQSFTISLKDSLNDIGAESQRQHDAALQDKRRSRSLIALTKEQQAQRSKYQRNDREAAIAYWRNSVLTEPVEPTMDQDHDVEDVPEVVDSRPSGDFTTVKPAQSFDFDLGGDNSNADLEERINILEVKMFDFEYAIANLQGVEISKPALVPRAARQKSVPDLYAKHSHQSISTEASTRRMISFSRPRPTNAPSSSRDEAFTFDQSSGTDTVRPKTSHETATRTSTPSTASIRLSRNEYETLMALIHDEKAARQQMEMQIMNLQKEIEHIRTPIFAAIKCQPSDSEARGDMARVKTLHRTPPFDFSKNAMQSQSRFSMDTESEFQSDYQEVYETPREQFTFDVNRRSPLVELQVS